MAPATPSPASAPVPVSTDPPELLSDRTIAVYDAMIASVPDAGTDGVDGILAAIAAGTEAEDIDAPWRTSRLDAWINRPVVVHGIRKAPSDYAGGLPWYLIVDVADPETGEVGAITTGSVVVMAQLLKLHSLDAFPARVIPRQGERPGRNGNYPQHLERDRS